ncbi:putative stage III sporulation protein AG [uncultured Eubacteriales bacterium]|uniref:Putative stage III sporulation protein AG n=1 Tax=uncultured Eubacteriales bacterium TaxID=172733 RepID=A0A212JVT8_9FIRM|nr:putative stage III sporulation protein AG [uncultured Eubacteriales bacterium]
MKGNLDLKGWGEKLVGLFSQYKYVFLVILVGVILLLLPSFGGEEEAVPTPALVGSTVEFDLAAMEEKLADAISEISGAGKAKVILTLKSGPRQVVAVDESASADENSSTTVVVSKGSGTQDAVVLQQVYPQYQGALIICPGGGEAAVKLKITEAVAAVTGLGAARISVCKGN